MGISFTPFVVDFDIAVVVAVGGVDRVTSVRGNVVAILGA